MDIFPRSRRSALMSRIRPSNTKPEIAVRHAAHCLGFRFRLHRRDLPGTPDLVFPRLKKVVFVHGCFWHRHRGCRYAYSPKSNIPFWRAKFEANVARDREATVELKRRGWLVSIIWECETYDEDALSLRVAEILRPKSSEVTTPHATRSRCL
jgi:DNA mismatch endonuclease, patch repair protein